MNHKSISLKELNLNIEAKKSDNVKSFKYNEIYENYGIINKN